jgi:hypothetical protein
MPLQAEYDSERLHPQHELVGGDKSGLLLKAKQLAISFLVQKGSNASSASFVQWLQEQNVPDGPAILKLISGLDEPAQMNMVEYFDMASRQRFVIEPGGDGVLYCRKPKSSPGGRGELCFDRLPFDTSNSRAAFNDRAGMAIWVQGPSGRFYSSIESELGKFHHSSFLAGRDVKAAGDWEVINGHLTKISAQSGHYRPPLESLQDALNDLQRTSPALITQAQVEVHAKADGSQVMLGAAQFLRLNTAELNRLYQAVPG